MSRYQWVRITQPSNIPVREGRAVRVGNREIAIFNLGHGFMAVENRCPHQGGPLADGILSGGSVVCPLHAWRVDLKSGSVVKPANAGACVETFATKVQDGIIMVALPMPVAKPSASCAGTTQYVPAGTLAAT